MSDSQKNFAYEVRRDIEYVNLLAAGFTSYVSRVRDDAIVSWHMSSVHDANRVCRALNAVKTKKPTTSIRRPRS